MTQSPIKTTWIYFFWKTIRSPNPIRLNLVDGSENGTSLKYDPRRKSLKCLKDQYHWIKAKILLEKMRFISIPITARIVGWNAQPQNLLMGAEILAETGNYKQALRNS